MTVDTDWLRRVAWDDDRDASILLTQAADEIDRYQQAIERIAQNPATPKRIAIRALLALGKDANGLLNDEAQTADRLEQEHQTRVYRLAWDGDPQMGGGHHVVSVGKEFTSLAHAQAAAARVPTMRTKPGLRIEARMVSKWERVSEHDGRV